VGALSHASGAAAVFPRHRHPLAMILLAESVAFQRFGPCDLMAYLGLLPSEYSSGEAVVTGRAAGW
jgi:transposase